MHHGPGAPPLPVWSESIGLGRFNIRGQRDMRKLTSEKQVGQMRSAFNADLGIAKGWLVPTGSLSSPCPRYGAIDGGAAAMSRMI